MALGTTYRFVPQDGVDERLRWFQAAVAAAPANAAAHTNLGIALDHKGRPDEAVACFKKAIELDPKLAPAHNDLGVVLRNVKGNEGLAIDCFKKAIELAPKLAEPHANLGVVFKKKGQLDEAITEYMKARTLNPALAEIDSSLGEALYRKGQWDEAVAHLREAIRRDPKDGKAHSNLGAILCDVKKDYDEAIACFRKAIEVDPKDAMAHTNLGNALDGKGQVDEAFEYYKKAVELDPKLALARNNLGSALQDKGQSEEATACYRKAVELDPKDAMFHCALGNALGLNGKLDEAVECFKKAIDLNPNYAEAHCNLGSALMSQGRFAESVAILKRGHLLGTKQPGWRHPSAEWVRMAEASAAIEAKLPSFLKGEFEPGDNRERLGLAGVCLGKKFYYKAATLYAAAFAAEAKLADDLGAGNRRCAACAAALAAAGRGEDAAKLEDQERTRLRGQARDWLRAELALCTRQIESGNPALRDAAEQALRQWQQDPELDVLRDALALAKVPAEEQKAFSQLWTSMAALLKTAERTPRKAVDMPTPMKASAEKPARDVSPLEETLKLQIEKLGPDHPDTLESMNKLGYAYWSTKQLDKSIPLFEQALKLREAKLGRDDLETLRTVANLGVNYRDAGRLKEALPLLAEAHRATKKYPDLRYVTLELLDAYAKAGEAVKLANLVQEELTAARKALAKDSPQLAQGLAMFGTFLLKSRAYAEAEPLLRECLAIRQEAQPDMWSTFNTKSVLGGALLGQKKNAEAEPLLLAGYEGIKKREATIPPQGKVRLTEALERLVQLYQATGKADEEAKWQRELEAINAARKGTEKRP